MADEMDNTRERESRSGGLPWLIWRFVDPQDEFVFVPEDQLLDTARKEKEL